MVLAVVNTCGCTLTSAVAAAACWCATAIVYLQQFDVMVLQQCFKKNIAVATSVLRLFAQAADRGTADHEATAFAQEPGNVIRSSTVGVLLLLVGNDEWSSDISR